MPYRRGTETVEVELSRLQSWIELADPDLYGDGKEIGVIREHRNALAEKAGTDKFYKRMVAIMGILGGVPAVIKILELLHVIPK